eukprot:COSAG06_NODE_34198_length_478_cov_0.799472_1_plen_84_part_10
MWRIRGACRNRFRSIHFAVPSLANPLTASCDPHAALINPVASLAVEEHLECEMATRPPCLSHGKAPRRYVARSEPSRTIRLMAR